MFPNCHVRFQFTPLREGRPARCTQVYCEISISIHAPPRGATCVFFQAKFYKCHFNSRPSARGDQAAAARATVSITFQFTPLREGRRKPSSRPADIERYFNSRPSARGDALALFAKAAAKQFQFTPLREGRPARRTSLIKPMLFQFTPLREGRHGCGDWTGGECISIHAPPRGATTRFALQRFGSLISIHAPPRGAT